MNENLTEIINAIMPYVITIVTAILGYVSVAIKNKIAKKLDTQVKEDVAKLTVQYVQQVYEALSGEEKIAKAMEQASLLLQNKGINISEVELRMLLESAVYGMNKEKYAAENVVKTLIETKDTVEETEGEG